MAKGWEHDVYEDDACLECGELLLAESRVPGLCLDCYTEWKSEVNHGEETEEA